MRKQFCLLIAICFIAFSCTDEGDGRIAVTTGFINMDETMVNTNYLVASAGVSISKDGNLPDGYNIESAGIIYSVDSSDLRIASVQIIDGVGTYDGFYGCFLTMRYAAVGRGNVVNIQICDTMFKDNGDIHSFDYLQIGRGEGDYTCPLINLARGTQYYLKAFAHISDGNGSNWYVYGKTKEFVSPGIHQDPSVFIELNSLGIAISKMDVEVGTGFNAQRYCSNINFYEPLGGYSDWRVPTLSELEEIYKLRNTIGGFSAAKYFSSDLWGQDIYYWYWDFSTNTAGHEELSGYSSLHGRLRLVRDL